MIDLDRVNRDVEADNYDKITTVGGYLSRESGEETNFSASNRKYLKEYFEKSLAQGCRAVLEIGVDNNPDRGRTSTAVILANKPDDVIYIGVDLNDKSHLNNTEKNIYTLQARSENIQQVIEFARSKGVDKFDFYFIDGWHSINQCIIEFDGYAPYLSEKCIIGFHDTNHHYGPMWLVEKTDRNIWNVVNYPDDPLKDFGIGFAWRK